MKQNIEKLSGYYQTDNIEYNRLSCDRTDGLEEITTLRYLNALIPAGAAVLDACADTMRDRTASRHLMQKHGFREIPKYNVNNIAELFYELEVLGRKYNESE